MVAAASGAACIAIATLNNKRLPQHWVKGGRKKEVNTNTRVLFSKSKSSDRNPPPDNKNKGTIVVSSSQEEEEEEELRYLWKLGGGCVAGGVAIKYGSVLFPAIPTTPNLTQALIMVSTPMLLSLLLLIRQTYLDQQHSKGAS